MKLMSAANVWSAPQWRARHSPRAQRLQDCRGCGVRAARQKQTPAGLAGGRSFLTLHFATLIEAYVFVKRGLRL
jgi:hypothetical protein